MERDSVEADIRGQTMGFKEAVRLAAAIRERPLWHVVSVEVASGTMLEWNRWTVMAICELSWHNQQWFQRAGMFNDWPRWAEATEIAMRNRQKNNELAEN